VSLAINPHDASRFLRVFFLKGLLATTPELPSIAIFGRPKPKEGRASLEISDEYLRRAPVDDSGSFLS
jgi:hypothetical protein